MWLSDRLVALIHCHKSQRVCLSQVNVAHVITVERLMVKATYVGSCPPLAPSASTPNSTGTHLMTMSRFHIDLKHLEVWSIECFSPWSLDCFHLPAGSQHFSSCGFIDLVGFKSILSLSAARLYAGRCAVCNYNSCLLRVLICILVEHSEISTGTFSHWICCT